MSMSSTGELETTPIGTFGPENISGTLVEFSNKVCFCQ